MSVRYPVALPATNAFRGAVLTGESVVATSRSPYTGYTQTHEHTGQWWRWSTQLRRMNRANAEAWITFLLSLRGRAGTFLAGDPLGATPRGTATGLPSPEIGEDNPSGDQIVTQSWVPSQASLLLAGDYLQVGVEANARLYKVLEDVASDGSGNATVRIWPDFYRGGTTPVEQITDGDMEALTNWTELETGGTVSLDAVDQRSGSGCFKCDSTGSGELGVRQDLSLEPNRAYRLSGYVKEASTGGATGPTLVVRLQNVTRSEWLTSTGGWATAESDAVTDLVDASYSNPRITFHTRPDHACDRHLSVVPARRQRVGRHARHVPRRLVDGGSEPQ